MDVTALISSLSATAELGKLIVNERDGQKLAALQRDLNEKILAAQSQLSAVLGTVIEQQRLIPQLEARIKELEAEIAEKGQYNLVKVGTIGCFYAYEYSSKDRKISGPEPVDHLLCQPCFDSGKKVVLTGDGKGYWACPSCKHSGITQPRPKPPSKRVVRY